MKIILKNNLMKHFCFDAEREMSATLARQSVTNLVLPRQRSTVCQR